MNLRQLQYIVAMTRNQLNVSVTAERLYTSQPGVSKQIRLLEDELGVELFERSGKMVARVTPVGHTIIALAEEVLERVERIRQIAREQADPDVGTLSIATTHTQARYALPPVIQRFVERYPRVQLNMHQGTPEQIAAMASRGEVDFAIATEALEHFDDLVMMPCYHWNRAIIVPREHPLCEVRPLTLKAIAEYPLITYVFGFTGRSQLDLAFREQGLKPRVTLTATDADVIKTYVRLGLGVGILARMAYDAETDSGLCSLDAGALFESSSTKIGFRRGLQLRRYMYDFIEMFAPHLRPELVDLAIQAKAGSERDALFRDADLPML